MGFFFIAHVSTHASSSQVSHTSTDESTAIAPVQEGLSPEAAAGATVRCPQMPVVDWPHAPTTGAALPQVLHLRGNTPLQGR